MTAKKTDLRKVLIKDYNGSFTTKGFFHQWGSFTEHYEGKYLTESRAIVEHEDSGEIKNYPPQMVKFES